MQRTEHVQQMAAYNAWMNERLYEAARSLPDAELAAQRGAFFGSILGTLNHLVVADRIWLGRYARHPACAEVLAPVERITPATRLDQPMADDICALGTLRVELDGLITRLAQRLTEADLDSTLVYHNTKGIAAQKNFFALLMHLFNHQTHHRGQATTLLQQAGVDVGVTDLLALIADAP